MFRRRLKEVGEWIARLSAKAAWDFLMTIQHMRSADSFNKFFYAPFLVAGVYNVILIKSIILPVLNRTSVDVEEIFWNFVEERREEAGLVWCEGCEDKLVEPDAAYLSNLCEECAKDAAKNLYC